MGFQIKIPVKLGFSYRLNLAGTFESTGKITLKSRNTIFTKVITKNFSIIEVFIAQGITTLDFTVKNQ